MRSVVNCSFVVFIVCIFLILPHTAAEPGVAMAYQDVRSWGGKGQESGDTRVSEKEQDKEEENGKKKGNSQEEQSSDST